jgi:beta-xylosidase
MRGQADMLIKQGIGHVAGIGLLGHKTPETIARSVNAVQRYLVTESRLRIPAIFHNEALNGVVSPHFTAFPTPIGLAATWDPAAVQEMADIMRRQMRAVGMLHALAPVMDVARDARWGRVTETYGEDPYLVSAMSVAFTRGHRSIELRSSWPIRTSVRIDNLFTAVLRADRSSGSPASQHARVALAEQLS